MPPNTVYVGRPGKFGNPFIVGDYVQIGKGRGWGGFAWLKTVSEFASPAFTLVRDNAHAVELYRRYRDVYPLTESEQTELRGKDLACWCKPGEPCHADVLIELTKINE